MKLGVIPLLALLALAACGGGTANVRYGPTAASAPPQARWDFEGDPVGGLPPGAAGPYGTWKVRAESDAPTGGNALCQTGRVTFAVLILGDAIYGDVALTTKFNPLAGQEDRAAGLLVRVQDRDNYYVLRANALENNVNLYKTVGGKRDVLKEGQATVSSGRWQELRLVVTGNRLQGFINGQPVVEATDDTFTAGKVGLWTKADSQTCFDAVEATVP